MPLISHRRGRPHVIVARLHPYQHLQVLLLMSPARVSAWSLPDLLGQSRAVPVCCSHSGDALGHVGVARANASAKAQGSAGAGLPECHRNQGLLNSCAPHLFPNLPHRAQLALQGPGAGAAVPGVGRHAWPASAGAELLELFHLFSLPRSVCPCPGATTIAKVRKPGRARGVFRHGNACIIIAVSAAYLRTAGATKHDSPMRSSLRSSSNVIRRASTLSHWVFVTVPVPGRHARAYRRGERAPLVIKRDFCLSSFPLIRSIYF